MKLLPGNSLLGICVSLSECAWERKKEGGTTQVLWGKKTISLLDSQRPLRVRTHLSGPLTSLASSFPVWIPEALDCPQGPQINFTLSPNTPQQLQSWTVSWAPLFTICVSLARPLLSAPQFPHMSLELIRVTAVWGCRTKPVITWKCLQQSENEEAGTFLPSSSSQQNEPWTAHGQRSCKSPSQATLWVS